MTEQQLLYARERGFLIELSTYVCLSGWFARSIERKKVL
jgi:hypothetical protein